MPIRRELRGFYPIDWKQLSAVIRFERAKGRCEACGRPHGYLVQHLGDGRWWNEERSAWRNGRGRALPRLVVTSGHDVRTTKVTLATAHLDHDPTNNPPRNLKALCQRCWRSIKYEEIYLRAYDSVGEARAPIGLYLTLYNGRRPHSSLDRMTPDQAYFDRLPQTAAA